MDKLQLDLPVAKIRLGDLTMELPINFKFITSMCDFYVYDMDGCPCLIKVGDRYYSRRNIVVYKNDMVINNVKKINTYKSVAETVGENGTIKKVSNIRTSLKVISNGKPELVRFINEKMKINGEEI